MTRWRAEISAVAGQRWSLGKNRANAARRREHPSRLCSRLRTVVQKLGLQVVGYEHEAGPAGGYPFWFDVWIRLPDGREAGIDTIWDSGVQPKPHHLALIKRRREWMQAQGHPYLYLDKKLSSIEMEMALRVWLRKVALGERPHPTSHP